jgi:hypothetical protein
MPHTINVSNNNYTKLRGASYAARLMCHISNINTLKSIYYACFHHIMQYRTIFWATRSIVERFSLRKRKSSELWLVHNPEPPAEAYLNHRFLL